MRMFGLVALGVVTGFAGSAMAQEGPVVRETRCWLGSVTFSAGASMNVGNGIAVCEGDRGWQAGEADAVSAGCLLEGELSSIGAVVGISNNDRLSLQCEAGGSWIAIAVETED